MSSIKRKLQAKQKAKEHRQHRTASRRKAGYTIQITEGEDMPTEKEAK